MNEMAPSEDDIAKLEAAVALARRKLRSAQGALRDDYAFGAPPSQTHITLTLSSVPEDTDEEARLMVADICRGELAQAVEALEIAKEMRRVDEVVKAREEEISFGKDVDDCPICLDPLYDGVLQGKFIGNLPCCAKEICKSCSEEYTLGGQRFKECPLCRHPYPVTMEYVMEMKEKHAKTKPRYQFFLAREYFDGRKEGGICRRNDERALAYYKKAAEGGDAEAQAMLGFLYSQSPRGIVGKSPIDALHWYEMAASNGHVMAHANVGFLLSKQADASQLAFRMLTFAAHHGIAEAQQLLSNAYSPFSSNAEGVTKSAEKAKFWLNQIVHSTDAATISRSGAYSKYGAILLRLQAQNMNGVSDVAGHSVVPEALYWFRKAKETNSALPNDAKLTEECEKVGSARCHCCKVSSEEGDMQKCIRCKWARYCSRECQLRHWSMGHKNDCKTKY